MSTLFGKNPIQSAVYASLLAVLAHIAQRALPNTFLAAALAEMTVAFIVLSALALLVIAQNRRGHHRVMNQTQEEVVLIGIFGIFWFAFLVGVRMWQQRGVLSQTNISGNAQRHNGQEPLQPHTPTIIGGQPTIIPTLTPTIMAHGSHVTTTTITHYVQARPTQVPMGDPRQKYCQPNDPWCYYNAPAWY